MLDAQDSGGYTYILLDMKGKKQWVAAPAMKVQKGAQLSLEPGYEMKNFRSPKLKKTFDSIIFSSGRPGGKDVMNEPHLKKGHPNVAGAHGGAAVPAEKKKGKVARATGSSAYTVAEVHEKAAKLSGKQVVVRGKVVKVSPNIMKKTWIHLADGTGSASAKTDDLVVTSQSTPKLDDIVTITGTLRKDADFGAGYKYGVIVENATISPK